MSAPRVLTVHPGPPLAGRLQPPGDKSVTHRAILIGLLARGTTRLEAANPGDDCERSWRCAAALGAGVRRHQAALEITGCPERFAGAHFDLDCGNSGTTLRLLAGLVASRPVTVTLAGDASLNRRPVGRVIEPLRLMGATLRGAEGDRVPPLTIQGAALRGIAYEVPVASAQVATAVLLAGLGARGATRVTLPGPARDHTERMLPAFGVPLSIVPLAGGGRTVSLEGPAVPRACSLRVPGDFSAAAFFLAAAAATPGARVTAEPVGLNPTRTGLLDLLERMGAGVERRALGEEAGEPVGSVTVTGPERLLACDVPPGWLPRMVDEVPAWGIASSAAAGRSRLRGAAELRVKESDRLAALGEGLRALGIEATEVPDGLDVSGGAARGGRVQSRGDHRIAMALALVGARASGAVTVEDAGPIVTSYPGFVVDLRSLGVRVEEGGPEVGP